MRILPIIFETLSNPGEAPLTLSLALTKSASIEDLFSKFRADRVIEITLTFEEDSGVLLTVKYVLRHLERQQTLLMEFSISDGASNFEVELDLMSIKDEKNFTPNRLNYLIKGTKNIVAGLTFNGLSPGKSTIEDANISSILDRANEQLRSIRCHWLAPLRASVARFSRISGRPVGIGNAGEGALEVLYADFQVNGPIFHEVSSWFAQNTNSSLDVVPGAHEFGALAGLALVHKGQTPVRIPIEDCGEGITQVLPVLVLAALAKHGRLGKNPFVVIEHPDLHLHNSAHFGIVDFIVNASQSEYKPIFLMESHSESMLVAAQLQVAEKKLLPSELGAYHISTDASGQSNASLVIFDENARPIGGHGALDWFAKANQRSLDLARRMVAF